MPDSADQPPPTSAGAVAPPALKSLLIISQVFPPDPAAVGQYMADVAVAMRRRGHPVRVYASNRGYEDPTLRYAPREDMRGVTVRRLPLSSFGKKNIATRLVGTVSFMVQCFFVTLTARGVRGILFSTSPPMVGLVVSIAAMIRRIPTAYWAMDLNPDQLIAMGKVRPRSPITWALERVNRFILRRTKLIVALDRFMAERLVRRAPVEDKLVIIPPWPHEEHAGDVTPADNPFRKKHGLDDGKLVVMYSGNHSPANPLTTLLHAMLAFRDDPRVVFAFVGGGLGKREVEAFVREHQLPNVLLLPYQPLAEVRYSLPAADVHVVSLGADMVGIVHPCKVYGAMSIGRPVLFLGPKPSHVADLLVEQRFGWHVPHGDVDAAVAALREIMALAPADLQSMGATARAVLDEGLGRSTLQDRFCRALESRLQLGSPPLEWAGQEGPPPCEPSLPSPSSPSASSAA